MKVLAIRGYKKSGKDTAAALLIDNYGAFKVSFADPLKDLVADEYSIPRADLDNQDMKEKAILSLPITPQDAFTRMVAEFMIKEFRDSHNVAPHGFTYQGSDFYGLVKCEERGIDIPVRVYHCPRSLAILKGSTNRLVDSNYWVKRAVFKIFRDSKNFNLFVIPDLRYKSEVAQLRASLGDKLVTVEIKRFDKSPSSDPSELDLDGFKFDVTIENKGTLEEFLSKVEDLVKSLNG